MQKNKRDRPTKSRLKKGVVVIVFAMEILLIFGTVFTLFRNADKTDIKKENDVPGVPDVPGVSGDSNAFGGEIIKYWNFDNEVIFEPIGTVSPLYGDNILISPRGASYDASEGAFTFSNFGTIYNGERVDPFFIFGYGTNTYMSEISYYMADFDVTVSKDGPYVLVFAPDFRDDNSGNKVSSNAFVGYYNGYIADSRGNVLKRLDSDKFNVTYLYSSSGTALLYIDGEYICTFTGIYNDGTTYCGGIKMTVYCESYNPDDNTSYSFDNMVISKFGPGYTGAIASLFEEPNVNLAENSDTIAYWLSRGKTIPELQSNNSIP